MPPRHVHVVVALALGVVATVLAVSAIVPRGSEPVTVRHNKPLLKRGAHVSAGLQPFAFAAPPRKERPTKTGVVSCDRPGGSNHVANCKSDGRPAVETWIVTSGRLLYAAAGDYDTWNGQVGPGLYWSRDGHTWFDGGPLDLFPHDDAKAGAGDPRVAVDAHGALYYSLDRFSFVDCSLGGIQLARRDPATGRWQVRRLAQNSKTALQDRPTLAVDASTVYVSWTSFASCSGEEGPSRIQVALVPLSSRRLTPSTVLSPPGSTFSEAGAIAADGRGGFWLAWEEYPNADAGTGRIVLAHWSPAGGWNTPQTISLPSFRDLPSPLPGFRFATNSAPALAVVGGRPYVAWASADLGTGRIFLWSAGKLSLVDGAGGGGDQLLPALAPDGHGGVAVAFSVADRRRHSLVRVLVADGRRRVVSSRPSYPNSDAFFSGRFIGDYEGMTLRGKSLVPVWTDLRGPLDGAESSTAMTAG